MWSRHSPTAAVVFKSNLFLVDTVKATMVLHVLAPILQLRRDASTTGIDYNPPSSLLKKATESVYSYEVNNALELLKDFAKAALRPQISTNSTREEQHSDGHSRISRGRCYEG
jgi:hypothetical protein